MILYSDMRSVELIQRNESVVTGRQSLEGLYAFKDFPVFFGCVNDSPDTDLRADMSWAIDRETGVIQLDMLIPLEILYKEQHFDGTGPTWQKYYEDFSEYIASTKPRNVLEIGGGIGRLADIYLGLDEDVHWTIIEPNLHRVESGRLKVINAFFDGKTTIDEQFDTIIFSQFMEHVYDPIEFVRALAKFAQPEGQLVFAYPNLKAMLEKKYTNAINFEHTMFLTDYFVDYLLLKSGFEIKNKTNYGDHSHFYHAKYTGIDQSFELENKYSKYKKIFTDFIDFHEILTRKLNSQIDAFCGPVYLFGAHIFSTYLLEFGLTKDRITAILDNSELKIGRRMYGYDLKVHHPQVIAEQDKVAVVLRVGTYQDEVTQQLLKINPKVIIIS